MVEGEWRSSCRPATIVVEVEHVAGQQSIVVLWKKDATVEKNGAVLVDICTPEGAPSGSKPGDTVVNLNTPPGAVAHIGPTSSHCVLICRVSDFTFVYLM